MTKDLRPPLTAVLQAVQRLPPPAAREVLWLALDTIEPLPSDQPADPDPVLPEHRRVDPRAAPWVSEGPPEQPAPSSPPAEPESVPELTRADLRVVRHVAKHGPLKIGAVAEALPLGRTAIKSILFKVVELGVLERRGQGKGTNYHATDHTRAVLKRYEGIELSRGGSMSFGANHRMTKLGPPVYETIEVIRSMGEATVRDLMVRFGLSRQGIINRLNAGVAHGLLEVVGDKPERRYRAKSGTDA